MILPRKKRCSKCKELKPCTSEFYGRQKKGKWGFTSTCRVCDRKASREYREKNKEKEKERIKKWHKENEDKRKEYTRQYKEEHKEELKEKRKQYYQDNKEKERERIKRYKEEHREEIKEYKRRYNRTEKGKEVYKRSAHKRRTINKIQTYTSEQLKECIEFFDNKCAYSGIELNEDNFSLDHIIPLSKEGDNLIYNIVPMDIYLNTCKNAKDVIDWYMSQEYFDIDRLIKIFCWMEYARNKWDS